MEIVKNTINGRNEGVHTSESEKLGLVVNRMWKFVESHIKKHRANLSLHRINRNPKLIQDYNLPRSIGKDNGQLTSSCFTRIVTGFHTKTSIYAVDESISLLPTCK